jgi:hypothetical protein
VPPFKISNMIRFRHGSLRNYASGSKKKSGRATVMSHDHLACTFTKAPALLHGEAESPQAARFSNIWHSKMEVGECH